MSLAEIPNFDLTWNLNWRHGIDALALRRGRLRYEGSVISMYLPETWFTYFFVQRSFLVAVCHLNY